MIVAKYPATHGHTTVINNLCKHLNVLGYKTAIGAFSFTSDPPSGIEKVQLNKTKLLRQGVSCLPYDIIHSHQTRVNYYLLFKKPKKPFIFHYHGASNNIQKNNLKLFLSLYYKRITKIISVSKSGIEQMRTIYPEIDAEVLYNGVDTEFFSSNLEKTFKKGEPQLLFVSALRSYKKAEILVNAMSLISKKFPNSHLQIVGTGEELINLKNLVKSRHLTEFVELTGKISDDELRMRYSSSDIYISASTFEVCPVPTLEAMSCGNCLVLYSIPPHEEIIEESKAGLTFTSFDANEICDIVQKVYDNISKFSESALSFIKNLDWQKISLSLSKIYQNSH